MAKYKPIKMNTTSGAVWTIFRDFGGATKGSEDWHSLQKPKYYKSEASALNAIKKRMEEGI